MKEQNFKNHQRYVFPWHILTGLALIALLIGSIRNALHATKDELYSASLIVLIALILLSLFWYARAFALKAQDRAIRAEENLRHFALTGKLLDNRLTMSQVIALRFAPDEELPSLAQKAVTENLDPKSIKKEIRVWRGDFHRV
jgi:hypothetical protein